MCENSNDQESRKRFTDIMRQLIFVNKKHWKIMQKFLDATGVYQAQHHLLMMLERMQFVSQKEIAKTMEVSTATIAVSLKKLESGGYIKKVIDESDNRLNQITITEKGARVVEESKMIFDSTDRESFRGFTDEELDQLSYLLKKLDTNLTLMEDKYENKPELPGKVETL